MLNRRTLLGAALTGAAGWTPIVRTHARPTEPFDLIVYGATPGGIIAAVEAASYAMRAVIVGGWRERHLGGMMSGGLSKTDYRDIDAFGGRARDFLTRVTRLRGGTEAAPHSGVERFLWDKSRRITGLPSMMRPLGLAPPKPNPYVFEPYEAEIVFRQLVEQYRVPVFWTRGVTTVERSGTRIVALTTADGQRFAGKVFIDASYEGDLLTLAGISYEVGRGPATPENPLDGFRGLLEGNVRPSDSQFFAGGAILDIDPFVEQGNAASGLIPQVRPFPDMLVGSRDRAIQAYNFRLCMTNCPDRRLDLPVSPPPFYDRGNYEVLFRYLGAAQAAGVVLTFTDLVIASPIGNGVYDVNARRGFSTDAVGLNWDYPEASYDQRELIWKAHEAYTRGFFYAVAYEDDPRVPDSLRQEVRSWGLVKDQFVDPHPNDSSGWPYQLYIREARRMIGELRWNDSDLNRLDGMRPRSHRIIALASYQEDSHHMQRLAHYDPDRHVWHLWMEGALQNQVGGHDMRSPLPLDIIVPRRSECTNLLVTFCASASHQAFAAIRMELCSMALGQAAGAAAFLACSTDVQPDIQDVDYDSLRVLLLRGGQMLDERIPPYWLIQVGTGVAGIGGIAAGAHLLRKRRPRSPVLSGPAAAPDVSRSSESAPLPRAEV